MFFRRGHFLLVLSNPALVEGVVNRCLEIGGQEMSVPLRFKQITPQGKFLPSDIRGILRSCALDKTAKRDSQVEDGVLLALSKPK